MVVNVNENEGTKLCQQLAKGKRAFCINGDKYIPGCVAKKLPVDLKIYGFERCQENCPIQSKCWTGNCKEIDRDIKTALALLR